MIHPSSMENKPAHISRITGRLSEVMVTVRAVLVVFLACWEDMVAVVTAIVVPGIRSRTVLMVSSKKHEASPEERFCM